MNSGNHEYLDLGVGKDDFLSTNHETQFHLLWPVQVWTVQLLLSKTMLKTEKNIFEEFLGVWLSRSPEFERTPNCISQETGLPQEFLELLLHQLRDEKIIDEKNLPFEAMAEKEDLEYVTACVFRELTTGRFLHEVKFLNEGECLTRNFGSFSNYRVLKEKCENFLLNKDDVQEELRLNNVRKGLPNYKYSIKHINPTPRKYYFHTVADFSGFKNYYRVANPFGGKSWSPILQEALTTHLYDCPEEQKNFEGLVEKVSGSKKNLQQVLFSPEDFRKYSNSLRYLLDDDQGHLRAQDLFAAIENAFKELCRPEKPKDWVDALNKIIQKNDENLNMRLKKACEKASKGEWCGTTAFAPYPELRSFMTWFSKIRNAYAHGEIGEQNAQSAYAFLVVSIIGILLNIDIKIKDINYSDNNFDRQRASLSLLRTFTNFGIKLPNSILDRLIRAECFYLKNMEHEENFRIENVSRNFGDVLAPIVEAIFRFKVLGGGIKKQYRNKHDNEIDVKIKAIRKTATALQKQFFGKTFDSLMSVNDKPLTHVIMGREDGSLGAFLLVWLCRERKHLPDFSKSRPNFLLNMNLLLRMRNHGNEMVCATLREVCDVREEVYKLVVHAVAEYPEIFS